MNIWTSLFLVISAVILAYPFLATDGRSSGDSRARGKGTETGTSLSPVSGHWNEEEIQLDLDAGRLDPDVFEPGTRPVSSVPVEVTGHIPGDTSADASESDEEDDGNLPDGSTAQ